MPAPFPLQGTRAEIETSAADRRTIESMMRTARDLNDERIATVLMSHLEGLLEPRDPVTHASARLEALEPRDVGAVGDLSKAEETLIGVIDHRTRLAKSDLDPRERRRLDETLAKAQRELGEEIAMRTIPGHRRVREAQAERAAA